MNLGIVGSEAAKFTPETEAKARKLINDLFDHFNPVRVVSGGCHLGGIDIWAKEEAAKRGIDGDKFLEFKPKVLQWDPKDAIGYKQRNEQISHNSDAVICITVGELPTSYTGMRFTYCYHCKSSDHIKSGGCWTVRHALRAGKRGYIYVIR